MSQENFSLPQSPQRFMPQHSLHANCLELDKVMLCSLLGILNLLPIYASEEEWIRVSESFVLDYNSIRADCHIRTAEVLKIGRPSTLSFFSINCRDFEFSVSGQAA